MPPESWNPERYQTCHSYVWRHGESLLELLQPGPGERILDLGCGSGQLTRRIAESGAIATGLDSSPQMIEAARANFPEIEFRVGDAEAFIMDPPVDAVFSNAALHWIRDTPAALEMGGVGNVQGLLDSIREVAGEIAMPWFFPSIGEYSVLLERQGFEVESAFLFDRPTRVEGAGGLEGWLMMFGDPLFGDRSEAERDRIRHAVADRMRAQNFHDGGWVIDYRRLRMVARRVLG
jgi:SAM-dependent methyltransferase